MKTILFIALMSVFSVVLIPSRVHAIARCADFIQRYYTCKFIDSNSTSSYLRSYYSSKPSFNNNFFEFILKPVSSSFEQAMDYFQSMNRELTNCTDEWCKCVEYEYTERGLTHAQYKDPFYYFKYYFNNATWFPQMVSLISSLKQKNTLVTNTSDPLVNYFLNGRLNTNTVVNNFCLHNEFNSEILAFYEEARECENNDDNDELVTTYQTCMISYLGVGDAEMYKSVKWTRITDFSNFSRNDLEQFTRCRIGRLNLTCNLEISRFKVFTTIWPYPQIITGNNLTAYIDSILSSVKKAPPLLDRVYSYMWSYSPIKSFKNATDLDCDRFDFEANCFDSKYLKIQCNRAQMAFKISFINPLIDKRIDYEIDGTSLPQDDVILKADGKKWLEIFDNPIDLNMKIILDYQTNSTLEISVSKWFQGIKVITLLSPRDHYERASGLLVDGVCPSRPTTTTMKSSRRTRTTTRSTTTTTMRNDEYEYDDENGV